MQTLLTRRQVACLTVLGIVAYLLTGFFGYDRRDMEGLPGIVIALDRVFAQPWPVYVWWGTALLTLQYATLGPDRLRDAKVAWPWWLGASPAATC